jgi:hypothetical protein
MKAELKTITPAIASEMLTKNTRNRPANDRHVKRLARQMEMGKWKINGDTICFSGDLLIDGQHRLLAVVQSGVEIEMFVVDGVDPGAFDTKDVGKRRSAADTLATNGEVNCRSLASAVCVVDRYMTGRMGCRVRYENNEVEALVEEYPGVRESINICRKTSGLLPQSILVACHYLFSMKDKIAADEFADKLLRGVNLTDGEPVYLLRERLLKNSISSLKLPSISIAAIIIKAWNAKRTGVSLRTLKYDVVGSRPEAFPVVK